MTIQEITAKIETLLQTTGTNYFMVKDVKIRVSDHSMNRQNNADQKTLSFISKRTEQRASAYNQSALEWEILENGLTDTYESIEDILEWEINNK